MTGGSGLRFGIDGYPYLAGLSAATVLLSVAAGALARRPRRSARVVGAVTAAAAVAASVPAVAGWSYVTVGKLRVRDTVLDAVPWRGDEVVVDLGCGLGLLAIGAARRTSGVVHGVDLFVGKDLLGNGPDRLRRNAERDGVGQRIDVRRDDVRDLSLPDQSVDVVLSSLCLHNVDSQVGRAAALAEIVRVLRPGGRVVISDLAHVDDEYAPGLRAAGLLVDGSRRVRWSFPPQRLLVARDPRGRS